MTWVVLALLSGVFNAFWTSRIKPRVQEEGAIPFSAAMRWGVALCLVPITWGHWGRYSWTWWAGGAVAGLLESLSVWMLARGVRHDYFAAYALSNVTPFFTAFFAVWILGETVTVPLALGIALIVAGALWLYWRGQWSWWGIGAAFVGCFSGIASKAVIAQSGFAPHACFAFFAGALALTLAGFANRTMTFRDLGRNIRGNALLILWSFLATISFYSALNMAPVNRVGPLVRVNLVVGFLLSVWLLGERERLKSRAFGAFLILAGIVLVATL